MENEAANALNPFNGSETDPAGKRPRQGSISERLRTASDLEERGYISREQKGIMKDLIISGDVNLQAALDKLAEKKDSGDLVSICKSMMHRRGSIDLLETMDLDLAFLGQDNADNEDNDFFSGTGDFNDDEGISISIDAIRQIRKASIDSNSGFRNFDDLLASSGKAGGGAPGRGGIAGRSASITSSSSMFGNSSQLPEDALLQSFHTNIFDVQGQVELSAYENMAKSLSASKPLNNSSKFIGGGTSSRRFPPVSYASSSLSRSSSAPASTQFSQRNAAQEHAATMSLTMAMMAPASIVSAAMAASAAAAAAAAANGGTPVGTDGTQYSAEGGADAMSSDYSHLAWLKRIDATDGKFYIGAYSPEQRRKRIERFIEKRSRRVWTKKVKYDVRKNFADSRLRVKGRFVKKEDEEIMREQMTF